MKKIYYIRTYFGGYIQVTKKQFDEFINYHNISSAISHDDYGYTSSDLYKLDGITIAYSVRESFTDV